MSRRSWIQMLVLAAVWGASYMFIKVALDDGMSAATVVFVRTALAALVLAPIAWRMGAFEGLRERAGAILLLAPMQVAAPFLLISLGEHEISSSLAGILVAAAPIFTFLLAFRLDAGDRARGVGMVGVAIGIAGVVMLLGIDTSGDGAALLGGLMVVLASLGYALGGFYLKRTVGHLRPIGIVTATMSTSAVMTLPLMLLSLPDHAPGPSALGALVALGVVGTGLAFVLFYSLIAEVGPSRSSLVAYVAPGFAVLYGLVLLDESFTVATAAGLILILGGSWLAVEGRVPGRRRTPMTVSHSTPAPEVAMSNRISHTRADERFVDMDTTEDIHIRRGTPRDALALGRLAQLDSTLYAGGDVLVAEADAEVIAAVPLEEAGRAFADPFRQTAGVVAMLELRREQITETRGFADRRGLRRGPRAARRLRRYRGHASA